MRTQSVLPATEGSTSMRHPSLVKHVMLCKRDARSVLRTTVSSVRKDTILRTASV